MKNRRNYYRILQVQPDAPLEIIRASYRTLMRELGRHPDLGGGAEEAVVLNEAYAVLSDPQRRAAYDDELFRRYTKQTVSGVRMAEALSSCPICQQPLLRMPKPGEICPSCRTPLQSEPLPESPGKNVRAFDRRRSSLSVSYYLSWPAKPLKGRMIDFSPKGMRFICSEKPALRSVLKLSCRLFEAAGIVKNISDEYCNGERCYSVGIAFQAVRFADIRGTFISTSV